MIRLLLLLSAAIFITLQIGGHDRGQKRFGVLEAEAEAAEKAWVAQQALFVPAPQPEAPPAEAVVTPASLAPTETPAPVVAAPAAPAATPAVDVKYVDARSVNVRSGPSTNDSVVDRLVRGEAVTVLWVEDNGWARVRVEGDGIDGYMSMDFLTDSPA